MGTLLKYETWPSVTAFSTTRLSPIANISAEELSAMGNYAAFNVTHYCGDSPERVIRNKRWLCEELNISEQQLWLPRQTHTDNILCVDQTLVQSSFEMRNEKMQNVDALITNMAHQCIGVSTADCIPILIVDNAHHAVAAIHAGWRGTVKKIALKTLQKMSTTYGTDAKTCSAIIGPGISVNAFEVGHEVVDAFKQAGFNDNIFQYRPYAKPHIDLWAANAFLLEQAGVPLQNIQVAGICTYKHYDTFFSARRLGIQSGRIFTAIMLNN